MHWSGCNVAGFSVSSVQAMADVSHISSLVLLGDEDLVQAIGRGLLQKPVHLMAVVSPTETYSSRVRWVLLICKVSTLGVLGAADWLLGTSM
jgi:hypothetical protein